MRKFFLLLVLLAMPAIAGAPVSASQDASSTNIPTSYSSAGATLLTLTSGTKSHIAVVNDTGTDIEVSVNATACGASSTAGFVVPDGLSATLDNVAINKVVCIKSLGSAISSGKVHAVVW